MEYKLPLDSFETGNVNNIRAYDENRGLSIYKDNKSLINQILTKI